jgi:GH24 family phage-related lysozyme (muramidase)
MKSSQQDYYSFGMPMPGRKFSLSDYRFGFNTQEKVNEISGLGNHNTAEFWEYDTRLGRRWNVDPIVKEDQSPYECFNDNPCYYADPSGQDGEGPNNECPGDVRSCDDGTKEKYTIENTWEEAKPAKELKLSTKGEAAIKKEEKFIDHVYDDAKGGKSKYYELNESAGNPTVAWGYMLSEEEALACKFENGCTKAEGQELFDTKILEKEKVVKRNLKNALLTQNEFDALVMQTYNGAAGKTLFKMANQNSIDPANVRSTFLKYANITNKKTGKLEPSPGLQKRANKAADIFLLGY